MAWSNVQLIGLQGLYYRPSLSHSLFQHSNIATYHPQNFGWYHDGGGLVWTWAEFVMSRYIGAFPATLQHTNTLFACLFVHLHVCMFVCLLCLILVVSRNSDQALILFCYSFFYANISKWVKFKKGGVFRERGSLLHFFSRVSQCRGPPFKSALFLQ